MAGPTTPYVVDIHTHVYPPSYIALLRSRTQVPYVRTFPEAPDNHRLIILPGEDNPATPSTARGRPVNESYWDVAQKIAFMDQHGITTSVISLANPWLDFIASEEAAETALAINNEIDQLCAKYPGRLYAFATLPLSGTVEQIRAEIIRLKSLEYTRGVILGTSGLGKGLDDPALDPIWAALEKTQSIIFLHPHYGLPQSVYGPNASNYGHVLPLALGFPLETTIAVSCMYLAGVWDRHPKLEFLLAHSGGTVPFLAGRIESCIKHDAHLLHGGSAPRRGIWEVLRENVYLDAVIYGDVGLSAAVKAVGVERVMFGTDHPFFPPLGANEKEWLSVRTNYDAIDALLERQEGKALILGGNAARIFRFDPK